MGNFLKAWYIYYILKKMKSHKREENSF